MPRLPAYKIHFPKIINKKSIVFLLNISPAYVITASPALIKLTTVKILAETCLGSVRSDGEIFIPKNL